MGESFSATVSYVANDHDTVTKVNRTSQLLRECLAELIGTFILIVFGVGVVAQTVLSSTTHGGDVQIALVWGLGVTFGVYFSAGVSGAHLNPAVSISLAVFKKFQYAKLPFYIFSQFVGAFLGAACVYSIYFPAFRDAYPDDHYTQTTGAIFATYPRKFESIAAGFWTETLATAVLVGGIFALGDEKNFAPTNEAKPIMIGLLIVAIGCSLGYNTGFAINPARDFGPRLFTFFAGWGSKVFTYGDSWWWVPIVAPCLGGVLGGGVYTFMVEMHHQD